MKKKLIFIFLFLLLFFMMISLYSTFSFDENDIVLEDSLADYNLEFSINKENSKNIFVSNGEERIVDIFLKNTYSSNVKYGIYYKLVNVKDLPENISITFNDDLEVINNSKLSPNEERIVSVKIVNNSDVDLEIIVGSIIGFENGEINDLMSDDMNLIK